MARHTAGLHGALVALLLFALVRADDVRANTQDEAEQLCHEDAASDGDDAGLSLRQLRAVGKHQQEPLTRSDVAADPSDKEAEFDPGLPGGWGEASEFATQAAKDEQEALHDGLGAAATKRLWGSCRLYRCPTYYVKWHGCQCNPGCSHYGTCCYDHYAACVPHRHHHHAPAPPPPPAPVPTPAPLPAPVPVAPGGATVLTLYHQTSLTAGPLILENGFRPGKRGWCGGGIYFALTPEATFTKAIGLDSSTGFLIEAKVNVGRVRPMSATCDWTFNGEKLAAAGFDSVSFDPGDGTEYVVYSADRVLSTKQVPLPAVPLR